MHLIESFSKKLTCVPVINEVAAGIAAEYFNEISVGQRALALVTAGPGLTNIVTAMAGAYLESRELLVIGGQVKTADLARGGLRQRGIQEIDGVSIAKPISVYSKLIDSPLPASVFVTVICTAQSGRKGPVFLEIPLDVQAKEVDYTFEISSSALRLPDLPKLEKDQLDKLVSLIRNAKRPMLLIGGGISRETTSQIAGHLAVLGLPIATTWNAADRLDDNHPMYAGRPNTWGQRSANLLLQQSDLLIALGTRLGMQQTGFNWQQFVPWGKVIHVDIDEAELNKGHPRTDIKYCVDANDLLRRLSSESLGEHGEWLNYIKKVRRLIPRVEMINKTRSGYISPFAFVEKLSELCRLSDIIIPCSSGGAFTVMMQTFQQKAGQHIVTNKGLASMGYGLSGAIGAAFACPDRRVILVEGDGGFAQNLQEIGTVAINRLNLKIFIFDDGGYASIRMTQRSYFGGRYVGCDRSTGLGLPDWTKLFEAWDIPSIPLTEGYHENEHFIALFEGTGTAAFIVTIDPEQTYFPKITSRMTETGAMMSNPLHEMTPELDEVLQGKVSKFLNQTVGDRNEHS